MGGGHYDILCTPMTVLTGSSTGVTFTLNKPYTNYDFLIVTYQIWANGKGYEVLSKVIDVKAYQTCSNPSGFAVGHFATASTYLSGTIKLNSETQIEVDHITVSGSWTGIELTRIAGVKL